MLVSVRISVLGNTSHEMITEARRRFALFLGPETDDHGTQRWRISSPVAVAAESLAVADATGKTQIVDLQWRGDFEAETV